MATKEGRTGAGGFRPLFLGIAILLGLGSPALAASNGEVVLAAGASTGNKLKTLRPAGGDDAGGGGTPQTPADMGGMPPMQQADSACGDGNALATVVINQPGLDKLNVRSGPGGQVVGTVPEGDTVSVVGPCGAISGAAGFAKPKTQPGGGAGGAGGWCQLSAPVHGCVSSQFLSFGGGDVGTLPGGAAGFAKSKSQPQEPASAGAGFSGRWAANADNVAYSLSLKQKGNNVSGNYQGADGSAGTISGKRSGNILYFSWVQKDGTRGSGKFVLADDGQSFDGSYNFSNNPDAVEGSWNGTRQ
ncbi:SH3 domain-containing protein [Mesorhizobium sp. M2E.F.Ca.ET.209.01.1.1]|uniref:SH3 domain-containing protein n=1 Tax=Mesorhizobium sp. M2E.F.Ca.ET.209.01.1.1 TaxID=2500526 RepID=UPI00167A54E8|nr:SH3 domain-containing protein [Mesorhizobium sp. M2E.F.Ca.ET.209.01.1.1]